jgi:hypothetical protein
VANLIEGFQLQALKSQYILTIFHRAVVNWNTVANRQIASQPTVIDMNHDDMLCEGEGEGVVRNSDSENENSNRLSEQQQRQSRLSGDSVSSDPFTIGITADQMASNFVKFRSVPNTLLFDAFVI